MVKLDGFWVIGAAAKRRSLFAAARYCIGSCFEAACRQSIAPIVAAARCFVSAMGMQRLQRIAGLAMIREVYIGFKRRILCLLVRVWWRKSGRRGRGCS
ncbi:MAG: hypothetical protein WCL14_09655 [Bacteroidota bacterium]